MPEHGDEGGQGGKIALILLSADRNFFTISSSNGENSSKGNLELVKPKKSQAKWQSLK